MIIPAKNSAALTAYYLAIFSVACGALLGIPAVILGLYGLKAVKANPAVHGTVHAWIGIILGGLTTLVTLAVVVLVVIAMQQK